MRVVVFSKKVKPKDIQYIQTLFNGLHRLGITAYVYRPFLESLEENKVSLPMPVGIFDGYFDLKVNKKDFFITLGGDGTILEASTHIKEIGVPILGINLGRLGFLATVPKTRINESLDKLVKGYYYIEPRKMLKLVSNKPIFGETNFALNDFTILKRDTSSMITIHTYLNGAYLNSYWADGLIVATPTGSTGYSLSCGGPVVFPNSNNFVITPVAPHNLNIRPVVISDKNIISFEVEGRAENFLCTLDSRYETINSSFQIAIQQNDFSTHLVQLNDRHFIDTLRNKLSWGMDMRNK